MALIVLIIHVIHVIWFIIAVKKRHELVELDKSVSLSNLRNTALRSLSFKNKKGENDFRNSSKIIDKPKKTIRIMYSYVTLKDKAVVKIHHKTDNDIKNKIIEENLNENFQETDQSPKMKTDESFETEMPSKSSFAKRKTILKTTKKSTRISDVDAIILA